MTEHPSYAPQAISTCAFVAPSDFAIAVTWSYSTSFCLLITLLPSGLYAVMWMLCSLQNASSSGCGFSGWRSTWLATCGMDKWGKRAALQSGSAKVAYGPDTSRLRDALDVLRGEVRHADSLDLRDASTRGTARLVAAKRTKIGVRRTYLALRQRDHRLPCLHQRRTIRIDGDLRLCGVVREDLARREADGPVNH